MHALIFRRIVGPVQQRGDLLPLLAGLALISGASFSVVARRPRGDQKLW